MARNVPETARSTYLLIDDGGVQRDVPLEALEERIRALDGNPLVFGYDVHAGFNVPDLAALASILRASDRQFHLEPTIINERETSGKKPFSPTQVYVEVAGKPLRRRIASERDQSRYTSQLPVDASEVEAAFGLFHRGLYRNRISPVLEEVRARSPATLGDYLLELHQAILRRQLSLPNVTVSAMRFDRCDPTSGSVHHGVEVHREHRFVYIGLSKEGIEQRSLNTYSTCFTRRRLRNARYRSSLRPCSPSRTSVHERVEPGIYSGGVWESNPPNARASRRP